MKIIDRFSTIPAWSLFAAFGVGVVIINLSTAPVARMIAPYLKGKIPVESIGKEHPTPSSDDANAYLRRQLSDLADRLTTAEAKIELAKRSHDQNVIKQANEEYEKTKAEYEAAVSRLQMTQLASDARSAEEHEAQTLALALDANSESRLSLAEEYVSLGMKVLLTLLMAGASLFVVLSQKYTPQTKHWGYGMLGTILGWWLKL